MLTPQEITEKKFDKVMVWGYDMNAVDEFLESVEKDYTQLYKENITLKSKMKVLVAKIEEYRTVDEQMRKALLNAQAMAGSIIEKAKAESTDIESKAQKQAENLMGEYKEKITEEEMRLEQAKTEVQAFIERSISAYKKEIDELEGLRDREFSAEDAVFEHNTRDDDNSRNARLAHSAGAETSVIPDTVPLPNIPPIPQAVPRHKNGQDIHVFEPDLSVNEEYPNSVKRVNPNKKNEYDEDETIMLTPKPRFEFKDLQFGKDYDQNNRKK